MGRERRSRDGGARRISDVNMTPLIDLTFLLLITFIIAFPTLEQGVSVRLPRGKASKIDQSKSQSVTIDVAGKVFFNNRQVSRDELEASLAEIAALDPQPPVLVRCDERVPYGELAKTLRTLNACRISRMALVTEPAE